MNPTLDDRIVIMNEQVHLNELDAVETMDALPQECPSSGEALEGEKPPTRRGTLQVPTKS